MAVARSARPRIGVLAFVVLPISDTFSAENFLQMTFLTPVLLFPPLLQASNIARWPALFSSLRAG